MKSPLYGEGSHFLDNLVFGLNDQFDIQDVGSYRTKA